MSMKLYFLTNSSRIWSWTINYNNQLTAKIWQHSPVQVVTGRQQLVCTELQVDLVLPGNGGLVSRERGEGGRWLPHDQSREGPGFGGWGCYRCSETGECVTGYPHWHRSQYSCWTARTGRLLPVGLVFHASPSWPRRHFSAKFSTWGVSDVDASSTEAPNDGGHWWAFFFFF